MMVAWTKEVIIFWTHITGRLHHICRHIRCWMLEKDLAGRFLA